jgi:hypothetical protein
MLGEKNTRAFMAATAITTTEKYIPKKKRIKLVKSDGMDQRLNDLFGLTWARVRKHEAMKPSLLYAERLEYQEFPLRIFWDHIYQEKRTRKFRWQFGARAKT